MRTDDGDRHSVSFGSFGANGGVSVRVSGSAKGGAQGDEIRGSESEQRKVGKRLTNKGNSERQPVGAEPGWRRDGREVQQVKKICKYPKPAVEGDRVALYFGDPKDIRGGRQQQKVDDVPGVGSLLSKSLQCILAIKCFDSRIFFAAQDNIAHHRVNCFGVFLDKAPDGRETLGHPWAPVQK